ncbi:MAG: hypothetical protein ABI950_06055 [Solirubrobacteraceae bacterium]
MATQEFEPPTIAPGGEPCPGCGAALAGDQRYCLQCGTRRGDARLPFRDALAGRPPGGGYVERVTERYAPEPAPDSRTGLTFLAGLACLLLALGVGVLIGRSGQASTPAKAVAPQVIQVGGAGAAAATTPATNADAASAAAARKKAKKAKGKAKASSSVPTAKSAKDSKATNKALKSLGNLSGKDYQKKAAKLPKQVGTGGKAPPVDKSKPAGGGSAVESIG